MKLIGSLMLAACPVIFGFVSAKNFKKNIDQIEKIIDLINFIIGEIKYKRTEIEDIINILSNKESFKDIEFLQYVKTEINKKPFPTAWNISIEKWNCSISKENKELLKSLSNVIGAYEWQGQITALEHIKMRFEENLKYAEKIYFNKAKLYRSLGILSGIAIFIVFI